MAYAEGETPLGNTFRSVFEKAIDGKVEELFEPYNKDFTFIFEGVSPENRVVTPYKNYSVYLLGVRNTQTGEFLADNSISHMNGFWRSPMTFSFTSWEEVIQNSKDLPAMEEGYVCYHYESNWRIKVKNPSYLAIAHLRGEGQISTKRIVRLVFEQDQEEYLSYFPEDRQFFQPYIDAYDEMIGQISKQYEKYKGIEVQKEFALKILHMPIKGVLFSLRKGLILTDIFDKMFITTKVEILEQYIKE